MNAKERLRAYLEQRRELGESEMVLDALDVDDVMRMLGALGGSVAGAAPAQSVSAPSAVEAQSTSAKPPAPPPRAPREPDESPRVLHQASPGMPPISGDWQEMMRKLKGDSAPRPDATPPPSAPPSIPQTPDPTVALTGRASGVLRVEGIVIPMGLRAERPAVLTAAALGAEWATLADVAQAIDACTGCALVHTATRPVPGRGDPNADVLVVGEAPGEKEDLTGEPFVGASGELLDKILGAIQLHRDAVFICNVLKHRPPGNRNPMPEEVRACAPFLQRQIDLVQPKMILAFGAFAAQSLLGTKLAIGKLRQQLHWYQGIPLIATYHPAALLRNDAWKRPTWEDVKLARRVLDATIRA